MNHARTFHALHAGPGLLILPNAWDAASAAIVAETGASAIATSSAAVAWTYGIADGDLLPIETTCAVVAAIVRAVDLPVSCDFEGGFTDDLPQLSENVARLLDAGAVGINFEDGRRDPDLHARKIAAVRERAEQAGIDLFINARTDVFLARLAEGEVAEAEAIRRGRLYVEAGASGVFAPAAAEAGLIGRLSAAIPAPLNILAWPGAPDGAALSALGVRRLSAGTGTFRVAAAALARASAAFLASGSSAEMGAAGEGAPNLQKRFAG